MSNEAPTDTKPPSLPPLRMDTGEKDEIIFPRPSSIPSNPSRAGHVASPRASVVSRIGTKAQPTYRFLSQPEWARFSHAVGGIAEGEMHTVSHPTCWYWPPKGLPEGLYKDVVFQRTKFYYSYHMLSIIRWNLMILQIILGAVLTALGAMGTQTFVPITILAVINTVDAGILGLMHNSGLPERHMMNKVEFSRVEDYIKELLDTGIVENGHTVDEDIAGCFDKFQTAKATVLANMPDFYASASNSPPTRDRSTFIPSDHHDQPDPAVHGLNTLSSGPHPLVPSSGPNLPRGPSQPQPRATGSRSSSAPTSQGGAHHVGR